MIAAGLLMSAGALTALDTAPATAQGWQWPWNKPEAAPPPPPRPPQPIYPSRPPGPGVPPPGPYAAPDPRSDRERICIQLEQRLAADSQRSTQTKDALPKIEGDLRGLDRSIQAGQLQLERNDCYEVFLFSKTLRRTRQCIELNRAVEESRAKAADLQAQRQQILAGSRGDRSLQDELIRELARYNCGPQYLQEAQRRQRTQSPFGFWSDDEGPSGPALKPGQESALPFATYRTICVRSCDGYFFPISFSTLPNHFPRDAEACQQRCPGAELYYYQNPGGAVEQAISAKTQQPYTTLKTAFRYRKELVQGCSCRSEDPERKAEVIPPPARTIGR